MSDMEFAPHDGTPGRSYRYYTGEPIFPAFTGISLTTFNITGPDAAAWNGNGKWNGGRQRQQQQQQDVIAEFTLAAGDIEALHTVSVSERVRKVRAWGAGVRVVALRQSKRHSVICGRRSAGRVSRGAAAGRHSGVAVVYKRYGRVPAVDRESSLGSWLRQPFVLWHSLLVLQSCLRPACGMDAPPRDPVITSLELVSSPIQSRTQCNQPLNRYFSQSPPPSTHLLITSRRP
jgi:hypothetical protein